MRRIVRFESIDGSLVLDLPLAAAEQEESQDARLALARPPLVPYAVDLQGASLVVADVATIRHRATLVAPDDAELDRIRALARRIGRGKLWLELDDGTRRWCWARAQDLGSYSIAAEKPLRTGITLGFARLSDWYSETASSMTVTVTGPTTVTLVSNGTVPTTQLTIEIEALGASGFTNPSLTNLSTAMSFTVNVASTAGGQRIRVSTSGNLARRAQFWNGTAWQDVPITLSPTQATLFSISPGTQVVRVTGVADGLVTIQWYDACA